MGFYGKVTNTSKTQFTFDKIYPNRKSMDENVDLDNIFVGRYVLVDYDQGNAIWRRVYLNEEDNLFYSAANFEDKNKLSYKDFKDGEYVYTCNDDGSNKQYYRVSVSPRSYSFTTVDDTNNYLVNFNIDKEYIESKGANFGRGFDSTVWTKVIEDGVYKYVSIADLNSVVPSFDIEAEAPTLSPITPHFDKDSTNVYYKLHAQAPWGLRVAAAKKEKGKENSYSEYDGLELSDEKTSWSYPEYNKQTGETKMKYYDYENDIWVDNPTEEFNSAIYYNKEGFSSEIITKSPATMKDKISLLPTGKTDNKYYNHEDNQKTNLVDTQELSISLPSIGNAISDMWDLIYGNEEINDGNARNLDIKWDSEEGLRLVDSEKNKSWAESTAKVETLAGAINTAHDIIGQFVIKDFTKEYNKENINKDLAELAKEADNKHIYYIQDDGAGTGYYRKRRKYKYNKIESDEEYKNLKLYEELPAGTLKGNNLWYRDDKDYIYEETEVNLKGETVQNTRLGRDYYTVAENDFAEVSVEGIYEKNKYYYKKQDNFANTIFESEKLDKTWVKPNYHFAIEDKSKTAYEYYNLTIDKNKTPVYAHILTKTEDGTPEWYEFYYKENGTLKAISSNGTIVTGDKDANGNAAAEWRNIWKYITDNNLPVYKAEYTTTQYYRPGPDGSLVLVTINIITPDETGEQPKMALVTNPEWYGNCYVEKDNELISLYSIYPFDNISLNSDLLNKGLDKEYKSFVSITNGAEDRCLFADNDIWYTLKTDENSYRYLSNDIYQKDKDKIIKYYQKKNNPKQLNKNNIYSKGYYYILLNDIYVLSNDPYESDKVYYTRNGIYLLNDYIHENTILYPKHSEFNAFAVKYDNGWSISKDSLPESIELATREEYDVLEKIPDFSRNMNTLYGLFLEIKNRLETDPEAQDTRDVNTLQGCINKVNDIVARFAEMHIGDIMVIDAYGRVNGATHDTKQYFFTTNEQTSIGEGNKKEEKDLDETSKRCEWIHVDVNTEPGWPHIKITHEYQPVDDTTTIADKNATTGDGNNKGKNDVLKLYSPIVDNAGHVVGKNTETVTLPYGFKTITTNGRKTNNNTTTLSTQSNIVADNTQDTLAINSGNEWVKIETNANTDTITISHDVKNTSSTTSKADLSSETNGSVTFDIPTYSFDNTNHYASHDTKTLTMPNSYGKITGDSGSSEASATHDTFAIIGDNWLTSTVTKDTATLTHDNANEVAKRNETNKTPNFGDTFTIEDWRFDSKGHMYGGAETHTVKIPQGSLTETTNKNVNNILTDISFTPSTGAITVDRTNIGALKLAGYSVGASEHKAIASTDTLNDALGKLQGSLNLLTADSNTTGSIKEQVKTAVTNLVDGAPDALDTLNEIADWIANQDAQGQKTDAISLISRVDTLTADNKTTGSVAKSIKDAVESLDAKLSQTAGTDGLALSIEEKDGKIIAISGSIKTNTYDSYGSASAVQNTLTGITGNPDSGKTLQSEIDDLETLVGSTSVANQINAKITEANLSQYLTTANASKTYQPKGEYVLKSEYDAVVARLEKLEAILMREYPEDFQIEEEENN